MFTYLRAGDLANARGFFNQLDFAVRLFYRPRSGETFFSRAAVLIDRMVKVQHLSCDVSDRFLE